MNPSAPTVTNQRITEETHIENGKQVSSLRMSFMVDGHGPFTMVFARDGFDPNAAKAKVQAFAQQIHAATH